MRRGLGRGLSQLRGDAGPEPAPKPSTPSTKKSKAKEAKETKATKVTAPEATPAPASTSPSLLPVASLHPNPRQPRSHFDEESLEDLARSIREHGVLQPILARLVGEGKYEIIAGERRWRAAQRAGLTQVPVMVRRSDAQQSLEWALIENVQREDIGAVECARAYQQLAQDFGLTQEQIAERVGKSRAAVANTLRVLRLPKLALEALEKGAITEGHARAILMLEGETSQLTL
ncbi:MAG: ParB/RepB/Spo0J family partition protein, partial [Fimbriimonadaceae bacterium]